MITIYEQRDKTYVNNNVNGTIETTPMYEVELRGLSTDEKPTIINNATIENGSTFIEIDTGKLYMYDLENQQWKEI